MKIEIRPEIGKSMCNCAMVKNGNYIADAEHDFSRNCNFLRCYSVFSFFRILSCYVKLTHVLVKVSCSTQKLRKKMSSDGLTGKT